MTVIVEWIQFLRLKRHQRRRVPKSTHNLILYTRCALNTEYGFEKSVKFFHQTLLTQIDIDFSDYNVFPGSYAEDIQFN